MKKVTKLCLFGLICGLVLPLFATELELVPGGPPFRTGWREVNAGKTPSEKLLKEPNYRSEQPLYLSLPFGNGKDAVITGVFDESMGAGKGVDTLYLDANNNSDLTDDPVLHPKTARGTSLDIEPVKVMVKYAEGKHRALWVKLEIRRSGREGKDGALWSIGCHLDQHMEGRIPMGRRNILIGIYDCSDRRVGSNGCFNDYCVDRLRMDINGDGKLDAKEEEFPLSRLITLDRKIWWKMDVDGGAKHVKVEPCDPKMGILHMHLNPSVAVEAIEGRIEFVSDDGYGFTCPFSGNEVLPFPESGYRISAGRLTLTESAGKTWMAVFKMPQSFAIKGGEKTAVRLGGPMELKARVDRWPTTGKNLCVFPGLTGVGGEEYENVSPATTRMRPYVKIVDTEGILVSQGKMDYG